MNQDIKYGGFSAVPSDYECPDGDLAAAINLIPEDGALKPLLKPAVLFSLDENQKVVLIHKTANFEYYIILDTSNNHVLLRYYDDSGVLQSGEVYTGLGTNLTIYGFNAVGNTLVILTSDGVHYLLWKSEGNYLYLGTEIPECPLSFGLQGEMVRGDEFTISFDEIDGDDAWSEFSDDNKTKITEQVLAKVNKFIADESTNAGKFIYPFLLRYAYRLYDGSLTKHSAPILMIASSDLAPQVFWTSVTVDGYAYDSTDKTTGESTIVFDGDSKLVGAKLRVVAMCHKIDYAVVLESRLNLLKNWADIVSSVDIFVSAPIYTYDQSGECQRFVAVDESDCYCVCKHTNQSSAFSTDKFPLRYQKKSFNMLYAYTWPDTSETEPAKMLKYPAGRLLLPQKSVDDVKSSIKSCSNFYLLESINLDDLAVERTLLNVEEDYLQSLVTRESMTDDYDSHDKLMPQYSFAYNSRLNVANITKSLFDGFHPNAMFEYTDGYVDASFSNPILMDSTRTVSAAVCVKQDGKEIVVRCEEVGLFGFDTPLLFFYYPNTNAYKAVVAVSNASGYIPPGYEIKLEQHDFLNGAFYFNGWDNLSGATVSNPEASADKTVEVVNKIYTSEINNPYYFPVSGINTVGTGTILGISAAAKALSEGQFGQFPLYAFTTEGIWALEVSDTGTYSTKQPISRDVCLNSDSITQIDSAVLFATDRGIMLIAGSQVMCISDSLYSDDLFSAEELPNTETLINLFNDKAGDGAQIELADVDFLPFLDFIAGCRMVYDYTNQRIVVYNPLVCYAYVYSMKSKAWGMMRSDITYNVNSYPEALAMADVLLPETAADGSVSYSRRPALVNLSSSSDSNAAALLITRPFKFGEPNVFKTINTVIQRGVFQKDHIVQVLYGSNDFFNWHTVWSSVDKYMRGFRGTPYKLFRLALVCHFDKAESLYGCSVGFETRRTNQLR